jgi:hypothetical protein
MRYERFKAMVRAICAKYGLSKIRFSNEDGMYMAEVASMCFTANSVSTALSINYGSGRGTKRAHTFMLKEAETCLC